MAENNKDIIKKLKKQDIVITENEEEARKIAEERDGLLIEVEIKQTKDGDYMLVMSARAFDGLTEYIFLYDNENNLYTIRELNNEGNYIEPYPLEPSTYLIEYFYTFEDALKHANEAIEKIKEIREKVRKKARGEYKKFYFIV